MHEGRVLVDLGPASDKTVEICPNPNPTLSLTVWEHSREHSRKDDVIRRYLWYVNHFVEAGASGKRYRNAQKKIYATVENIMFAHAAIR